MKTENYIGTNLRIVLNDKRTLEGILTVIDPFGNILLSNAFETSTDKLNPEKTHTRELGLASIPRTSVDRIWMDKKTYSAILKV